MNVTSVLADTSNDALLISNGVRNFELKEDGVFFDDQPSWDLW